MRKRGLSLVILILVGVYFILINYSKYSLPPKAETLPISESKDVIRESSPSAYPNQILGVRTKVSNCLVLQGNPDPECTPGGIFPEATIEQICTPEYSKSVREVSQKLKDEVFREYGVLTHNSGEYEIDHLISLELGGSNDISNLWPQPAQPKPGFHEKDKVENYLHEQVCKGHLSLRDAQIKISKSWQEVLVLIP